MIKEWIKLFLKMVLGVLLFFGFIALMIWIVTKNIALGLVISVLIICGAVSWLLVHEEENK